MAAFSGTGEGSVPKSALNRLIQEYKNQEGFDCINILRLHVVDYEDCNEQVKTRFNAEVAKLLAGAELLMEVKDEEDTVKIYGEASDNGNVVKNCVLFVPEDGALICAFRSIPLKLLMKVFNDMD